MKNITRIFIKHPHIHTYVHIQLASQQSKLAQLGFGKTLQLHIFLVRSHHSFVRRLAVSSSQSVNAGLLASHRFSYLFFLATCTYLANVASSSWFGLPLIGDD